MSHRPMLTLHKGHVRVSCLCGAGIAARVPRASVGSVIADGFENHRYIAGRRELLAKFGKHQGV